MSVTRVLVFIADPNEEQSDLGPGVCSTLSFSAVADANTTAKAFTCMYAPPAYGSGIRMAQPTVFLGTNAAVGKTYQTLRPDLKRDDGTAITREFISARLDPDSRADSQQGRDSTTKEFSWLNIPGENLTSRGEQLYWLKDLDPIDSPMVAWTEFTYQTGDTGFFFENGLANWIHIRGVDDGSTDGEVILSSFVLRYRPAGKGEEGRDS